VVTAQRSWCGAGCTCHAELSSAATDPLPDVLTSPDFLPLRIDPNRRVMTFVRMSLDAYRDSVFLDGRTRRVTEDAYELRLDDLLFAHANRPIDFAPAHYILHTAYCCSTLLARYFELLPSCFVLKEPRLLTQMALTSYRAGREWERWFSLSVRLLTRTYGSEQVAVIKVNDWCNTLGEQLLAHNPRATVTFLMMPLRDFVLAVLKSSIRREWVHTRIVSAVRDAAASAVLAHLRTDRLTDGQAASYIWLVNRLLCGKVSSGPYADRVLVLDGRDIAECSRTTLHRVLAHGNVSLDDTQILALMSDPSIGRYSKDLSRPYDATSRRAELDELDDQFGHEADEALDWVAAQGIDDVDADWEGYPVAKANMPALR